jgi:hypothetical protein
MNEDTNIFPMDFYVDDPSPRPWKLRPEGHLVVILSHTDEGQRAEAALVANGFADTTSSSTQASRSSRTMRCTRRGGTSRTKWLAL